MYSVSADYLTALSQPFHKYKLTGTIDSTAFDEENIITGSLSVSNRVSEGSEIKLGSVYTGELRATFTGLSIARGAWVGKAITLSEGLQLADDSFEYVPIGIFYISEAKHTAQGVEVVAYDAMTKFDKNAVRSKIPESGTPYGYLVAACDACNVTLGSSQADISALPNGTETLNTFVDSGIETWRDLIGWVAQTLCGVSTINRSGALEVRQYSMTSAMTIDETQRFTGCSFSDFEANYTGMSAVNMVTYNTVYKSVSPDDGLTYNLGQNPLVQDDFDLVQNIIDDFSTVSLAPFSAQMLGGAIFDLCDCLTFSGGIAAGAVCGVMGYTWKYNGAYSVSGFGSNPALASAKSKTEKNLEGLFSTVANEINEMSIAQNASAVTIGENTETSLLTYNFEVTQEENTTMIDVSVVLTSTAVETVAGEVYSLEDIVAALAFYVDDVQVTVYNPEFIIDEGKDTMTFNYSLSGLSVGAHEFDVRLTMAGGTGAVASGDVHEMLWGYGITFEVYVKSIEVTTMPARTVFYAGQKLDYTGVQIDAVYNNGLHTDVTAQSAFDPEEETVVTQDDVGTITVDVNATVDDVPLATSFEVMVKDGTWKGKAIYQGFRPYDALLEWVNISDFTRGAIWGVGYPGSQGVNDEDAVGFPHGWGTEDSTAMYFVGNNVSHTVSLSLAPSGKTSVNKCTSCLGGGVYWWESNGNEVFAKMYADAKSGLISQDVIGEVPLPTGGYFFAYDRFGYGITIPMHASSASHWYGENKDIYVFDTSNGNMTLLGEFSELANKTVRSVVLNDGTEYHLFCQSSTSLGGDKYLVAYKNGVLSIHALSIAGRYAYSSMYYDATNNVLVAYFGNKTYESSKYTYETKCYQIDPYDFSATEVVLPNSLVITTIDNDEDASHASYDTAEAVVLLNGTTDGQTDHSRYTYNGRICIDNPVTQYNYGYFDPVNGKRTPQQFLMLDGWASYGYYPEMYRRICYIGNLYFEQSDNNRIFLKQYHSI